MREHSFPASSSSMPIGMRQKQWNDTARGNCRRQTVQGTSEWEGLANVNKLSKDLEMGRLFR